MFCKNCGRQIPDNAAFCPGCGSKRSGGDVYGDGRSDASIKDLPSYTKENDLNRSGFAIDTNREKFSLSGDSGKNKFSLSDKSRKDDGDGIVRISSGRKPEEPPKEPTGFVNPLKNSGKTVFRSDSAKDDGKRTPIDDFIRPEAKAEQERPQAGFSRPDQGSTYGNQPGNSPDIGGVPPGGDSGEPTGFVNPLKDSGQDIHWGSDGDRNTKAGDFGEINSHMGFAIIMTVLGGCDCISLILGIIAIVYASKVSAHVQNGNFEEAKKCSDTTLTLCWISLGIKILVLFGSIVSGILESTITP